MRLPRFRFHIRTLLCLVALVALALVGHRIYRAGPEAHWVVLKLRYGSVETRRAAANDAWNLGDEPIHNAFDYVFGLGNPPSSETRRARRQRQTALLLPALARAARDSDSICRARALVALHLHTVSGASEPAKALARGEILNAIRDADASVRLTAVRTLVGLTGLHRTAVIAALRSALADQSWEVRHAAALELGILGREIPETQPAVASILIPILAGPDDSRVRIGAAWALYFFGRDPAPQPPESGPDVVPALVAALQDRAVEVRRTAAVIFGRTRINQGRALSLWDQRKDSIIPALKLAIADDDKETRENIALALFAFGSREIVIIKLIVQAAGDPARTTEKSEFASAKTDWEQGR
jgi:HEAT repeat protein